MMFANGGHADNNASSTANVSGDGFLSSIINEEDLQLMEMAMTDGGDPLNSSASSFSYFLNNRKLNAENESEPAPPQPGMYTMRMLENDDVMDTSSDSAVSSMGSSERVPSISDGQEWMETTSEAGEAEHRQYYGMECTQAKYRQFGYSYAPGMGPGHRAAGDRDRRMPPVAQKKYQLFGKRLTVEPQTMGGSPYGTLPHGTAAVPQPPSVKYPTSDYRYPLDGETGSPTYGHLEGATAPPNTSQLATGGYNCSLDYDTRSSAPAAGLQPGLAPAPSLEHVHHNHTYQMSPEDEGGLHRPAVRDKLRRKMTV